MSVIIPNMKMPMSCLDCPLAREMFNCLVCVGYFKDNLTGRRVYKSDLKESDADFNRPDWCPLLPLPAGHGRLGDLDKLVADFRESAEECKRLADAVESDPLTEVNNKAIYPAIIEAILRTKAVPTIVPAEGDSEADKKTNCSDCGNRNTPVCKYCEHDAEGV